ncbi:N-acetylglucosamine-6-sulfatase-like isoform X2 [Physella acuta]|uniref:N-acetylglucosamine-6-sulfatase-like isoform X2 n=1 Tax=Physella acuta TaxID=109671 RepID=UPI0027DC5571|nr:N-acetylglucosamine-6-sulfatase-like isoform X2 [Physella acuta]
MASSKDVATMMILLGFLSMALCYEGSLAVKRKAKQPNIVFILTDDQDVALFGQYPMPKTKKLIADVGMTFTNMFVTSPLCCPSRSSILSGRFLHNHMTTNNSLSGNCSSTAWQNSAEKKAFPTFLQANGYRTFFAGKYLNEYGSPEVGGVEHIPPGWDVWNGLVGNSVYYNYTLSADGKAEKHGDNYSVDYLTDVIHHKALKFLTTRTSKQPFFMMLSTPACHSPFKSAPQYMVNFTNEKAPRNKQFNIHAQDKHWLIQQAVTPMPNDTIDMIDGFFRNRWRTLLSVDDMVEGVINKLTDIGELDNTYIFFSSDNGYHLGQFSLPFDKRQFYDFDIRVPLMVRGPGIKANTTCQESVMSVDLAPTFLDIANLSAPPFFDGMTLKPILQGQTHPFRATVLVEYNGERLDKVDHCPKYNDQGLSNCDNHCVCEDAWNNTYGCIRYETQQESYKYCALQDNDNFVEVYDLKADPYELNNIAKTASPDLLTKLSQDLADLSLCSGSTCHKKSPYPSH